MLDRISIIPKNLRLIQDDSSGVKEYSLLLDATVTNLYGYDIEIQKAPIKFQLISQGMILPVSMNVLPDLMPKVNFYTDDSLSYGSSSDIFRWIPYDGNGQSLAPGFSSEGSFLLNQWSLSPPPSDMLLLIMYDSNPGIQFQPRDWALYQLDDLAADLVNSPISQIDKGELAIEEAKQAQQDGDWTLTSLLLAYARDLHPGNKEVGSLLEEAQKSTGSLIFREDYRENASTGYRIHLRNLGDSDSSAGVVFESPQQINLTSGSMISIFDEGILKILFMSEENNQLTIHISEIRNDGEKTAREIPVVLSDKFGSSSVNVNQYAWSITGNDELLFVLDEFGAQSRGIIKINTSTGEVAEYDLCDGTGWITSISLSPDGQEIAFVDRSKGQVLFSNIGDSNCIPLMDSPTDWVKWGPLGWSQDGNKLFVIGKKEILVFSDLGQLIEKYPFTLGILVDQITISPDGRYLVMKGSYDSYSNQVYFYDMRTNQIYEDKPSDYELIGWIP